jgi:putative ABC transport system permease protein
VGYGAFLLLAALLLLGSVVAPALADAVGRLPASLSGVTGRLARRNATRVPTRTAANANALLIGVALVGLLSVVAASVTASANHLIDQLFNGDYIIQTNGFTGVPSGVATSLAADSEVSAVGVVRSARAGLGPARIGVSGANPAALRIGSVHYVSGSYPAGAGTDLLIDQKTATDRHLSVGSTIAVTFPDGPQTAAVAAVYADNQLLGSWLMPLAQFESHFPAAKLDDVVLVDMKPGSGPAGTAQIAELTKQYPSIKVQDKTQLEAQQRNSVNQLLSLFTALLVLALLIAFLGIANTLALSILERTRELGILRALGMSRRRLRAAVRWESVILSAVGAIEGLVFGVVAGVAVISALRTQGIHDLVVPWVRLIVYLIVACVLGVGAGAFPARRAAKLRILSAIAVPE